MVSICLTFNLLRPIYIEIITRIAVEAIVSAAKIASPNVPGWMLSKNTLALRDWFEANPQAEDLSVIFREGYMTATYQGSHFTLKRGDGHSLVRPMPTSLAEGRTSWVKV